MYKDNRRASFVKETEEEAVREGMLWMLTKDDSAEAEQFRKENLTLRDAIDLYVARRDSVLSPSTIRGYEQIKNLRFQSVMDRPIGENHNWTGIINDEVKDGLSPKTIHNAWGLIRSVLKENNVKYSQPLLPQLIIKEAVFLQPNQIKPFIDAVRDDRFELAYLLCLHSLRRSEMLALEKSSVTDGKIYVRGAVVEDKDGALVYKKANKTSASRRTIPVFIDRLNDLVKAAPDKGRLVPHATGNMFDHLHYLCRKNGLPELGFHSLRHSFASLCYHLGISEMGCQQLGGWDDPGTMRKIYQHLADEDKRNAEDKLKGFFDAENHDVL